MGKRKERETVLSYRSLREINNFIYIKSLIFITLYIFKVYKHIDLIHLYIIVQRIWFQSINLGEICNSVASSTVQNLSKTDKTKLESQTRIPK